MILLLLSPLRSEETLPMITLHLAGQPTHPIPEKIFGQFLERATFGEPGPEGICDENGDIDPEALELLKGLEAPVIRFPGGSDIDYIDWRDMIDHVPGRAGPGRPITRGWQFSPKNPEAQTLTNRFGWDEYWRLQKTLGNETIVVLNFLEACARKAPLREATLKNVGLVAYCNAPQGAELPEGMPDWAAVRAANGHPQPFGAEYVQIGNEWFLARWEQDVLLGLGLDPALRGGDLQPTPEQRQLVADWMRESLLSYIRCIRKIDPEIKIIIDERMIFGVQDIVLRDPEIRKEVGYLAKHAYSPMSGFKVLLDGEKVPVENLKPLDYWFRISAMPGSYKQGLAVAFNRTGGEYTDLGYKMAYTEWNWNGWGWQVADGQVGFPYRNAVGLGVAAMYHGFFRDAGATELATQSMMIGKGWDIAAVNYSGREGAPLHFGAQGQVSWFYRKYHGLRFLPLEIENNVIHEPVYTTPWNTHAVAQFDAVATEDDEALYVHMVNRSFEKDQPVLLTGLHPGPESKAVLHLMVPRDQAADDVFRHFAVREEKVDEVLTNGTLRLPPRSISCLKILK